MTYIKKNLPIISRLNCYFVSSAFLIIAAIVLMVAFTYSMAERVCGGVITAELSSDVVTSMGSVIKYLLLLMPAYIVCAAAYEFARILFVNQKFKIWLPVLRLFKDVAKSFYPVLLYALSYRYVAHFDSTDDLIGILSNAILAVICYTIIAFFITVILFMFYGIIKSRYLPVSKEQMSD